MRWYAYVLKSQSEVTALNSGNIELQQAAKNGRNDPWGCMSEWRPTNAGNTSMATALGHEMEVVKQTLLAAAASPSNMAAGPGGMAGGMGMQSPMMASPMMPMQPMPGMGMNMGGHYQQ